MNKTPPAREQATEYQQTQHSAHWKSHVQECPSRVQSCHWYQGPPQKEPFSTWVKSVENLAEIELSEDSFKSRLCNLGITAGWDRLTSVELVREWKVFHPHCAKGSSLYLAWFFYQVVNRVAPGTGVSWVIMLRITSFVVFFCFWLFLACFAFSLFGLCTSIMWDTVFCFCCFCGWICWFVFVFVFFKQSGNQQEQQRNINPFSPLH